MFLSLNSMLYQFHVNKMKSLRRITRCLYEGSVFNTERAASSRRWQHTSRFSITVPCTNVADLIMKDFGKFSNKVALVSTLWLFMYRICTRSYNLLEDIIKDVDVSNGTRSLKIFLKVGDINFSVPWDFTNIASEN